jgi:adenosyl cobinamide kinase/adenosyl cobinamide phosphate guanylyltransferase
MALEVLLGGARSGKSALAVRRAAASGRPVVLLATGEARDAEMADRIARHRAERPAGWTTVEEPLALEAAVAGVDPDACLVVDCLSLWVANVLERGDDDSAVQAAADRAAARAAARPGPTLAVSNEVGLGLVPMDPLGRRYRDVLGRVNAAWARAADRAGLVVAGRILALAPAEDG